MSAPRRPSPDAARRGWCPGLARPMPTGDGLLARIHPPLGVLSLAQVRAVAEGARGFGNGHVDVTARANIQIRGVSEATRGPLARLLEAAGLGDARTDGGPQRLTLTGPLAGRDPGEVIDVPRLARAIEAAGLGIPGLPAKTLVAVQGRPGATLPDADFFAAAVAAGRVGLSVAGNDGPHPLAVCDEPDAPAAVAALLAAFAATGRRRARDLSERECCALAGLVSTAAAPVSRSVPMTGPFTAEAAPSRNSAPSLSPPAGRGLCPPCREHSEAAAEGVGASTDETPPEPPPHRRSGYACASRRHDGVPAGLSPHAGRGEQPLSPTIRAGSTDGPVDHDRWTNASRYLGPSEPASGPVVLALDAPFGRCTVKTLDRLAATAENLGADEIRLSHSRGFVILGMEVGAVAAARADLATDFITAPDDPRRAVAACTGAPACAAGTTPTLADAGRLADAFRPFAARGLSAHVSGCAKGCAHPAPADLTLVGREGLYGVLVGGAPGDTAPLRLPIEAVLERLGRAVTIGLAAAFPSEDADGGRTQRPA